MDRVSELRPYYPIILFSFSNLGKPQFFFFSGQSTKSGGGKGLSTKEMFFFKFVFKFF